jgi:hypothetical protein
MDTVIFHYDILRPHDRKLWSHARDPAFHLIGCGRRLTVITLVHDERVIVERATRIEQPSKRRQALAKQYKNKQFLRLWHDAWLDSIVPFVRPGDVNRIVVADDDYSEIDRSVMNALLGPNE